jgi:hypothetical protein
MTAWHQWLLPPSKEGAILGYCGLVPFVFLGCVAWLAQGEMQQDIMFGLLTYAASIVSFLGAIHWGLALREPVLPTAPMLVWAVIPSLVAWCALMVGSPKGLWILVFALWFCLGVDWKTYPRYHLKQWLGMRVVLTIVASLACVSALLAVG